MEAGLIATIVMFAWGLIVAVEDKAGSVHTTGVVLMAVAVGGALLTVGGHFFPRHPHRS